MKHSNIISLLFLLGQHAFGQATISIESQAYPAGFINSLRIDYALTDQIQLFARGGVNETDRQNWGVKDNEEGNGTGFGAGVEISSSHIKNLSLILRSDLWFMDIDWTNFDTVCPIAPPCFENRFDGTSKVTVLQPTLGVGYQIPLFGSFFLKPSVNIGYEINVYTRGEPVGEGAILLGGIQVGYEF
ncbi:MAG: hypothetical protein JJ895_03655 [Balneolaceae bacterium]|nr:hypothetical protein [Balneolaceae bacterium]